MDQSTMCTVLWPRTLERNLDQSTKIDTTYVFVENSNFVPNYVLLLVIVWGAFLYFKVKKIKNFEKFKIPKNAFLSFISLESPKSFLPKKITFLIYASSLVFAIGLLISAIAVGNFASGVFFCCSSLIIGNQYSSSIQLLHNHLIQPNVNRPYFSSLKELRKLREIFLLKGFCFPIFGLIQVQRQMIQLTCF